MSRWFNALCASFGMFSILPVPKQKWNDDIGGLLLPMFPVVGLVIGGVWCAAAWGLAAWQPPTLLHAVFLCLVPCVLTGFLHLDGYLDVADAVLSRRPLEERRRILKDPHLGSFGAIVLVIYCLLAFGAAHALVPLTAVACQRRAVFTALVCIPVLSRCACGVLVLRAPLMAQTGYAALYRKSARPVHTVWLCALGACCCVAGALLGGFKVLCALLAGLAGGGIAAWGACRSLGGVNGDVSGCALTVGELCALLCLALG